MAVNESDRLILPEYPGEYEFTMGSAPEGQVRLAVISQFSGNQQNYRNYPLTDTIKTFREKLQFIVGTEPKWMEITIKKGNETVANITADFDETKPLSSFQLSDGMEVHIQDKDPSSYISSLMDTSNVTRFQISEDAYAKRENSVRKQKEEETKRNFKIGAKCLVLMGQPEEKNNGKIAYVGEVEGTKGLWIGAILNEPKGKNSGEAKGKSYFTCDPNCGVFVRPDKITVLEE